MKRKLLCGLGCLAAVLMLGMGMKRVDAATGVTSQNYSNLVVFVQFKDSGENFMSSKEDVDYIVRNYTDETFPKSLTSFVDAISYGQMHIHSYLSQYNKEDNTIIPITLPKNRSEYEDDNSSSNVTKDVIDVLASSELALSREDLDQDHDGTLDNLTLICQGAEGERASVFYPHKEDYPGEETIKGVRVRTVNVLNSEAVLDAGSMNSYGVICHEFLHSLGYPDLYTESGSEQLVERWDLMASSSNYLQYPLTYLRSKISGWLPTTTITPEDGTQTLTLSPAESSSGNRSYVIQSPLSSTEFFVIEYRKQGEKYTNQLEVKIPGTGLIAYRINTKQPDFTNHHGLPYGVYVYRPGETSVNAATKENLNYSYFSKEAGRTTIGTTDLNATIKDNALVFSDGTNSGIEISEIGSAGDTISCKVKFADYANANMWNTLAKETDLTTSADSVSIDQDDSGNVYVAYGDNSSMNSVLKVKQYSNGSWKQIGDTISDFYWGVTLRTYKGTPYILYKDSKFNVVFSKFENGAWKIIKTWNSTADSEYNEKVLKVGVDGVYIAYVYANKTYGLEYYDGLTVKEVIAPQTKEKWIANIDISAETQKKYIAYRDVSGNKPVICKIENGTISELELKVDGTDIMGDQAPKVVAVEDRLYLLQDDTNLGLRVFLYDGTKWTQLKYSKRENGSLSASNSPTSNIVIMDGVPVIQLVNQRKEGNEVVETNTQVFRYRMGDWIQEGNNIDTAIVNEADMCVQDNKVYLVYLSEMSGNQVPMVKYKELQLTSEDIPSTGGPVVSQIQVIKPTKTEYKLGESFDASGIVVKAAYSDMSEKEIPVSDCTITGFDSKTEGEKTVTVKYQGCEDSFVVTVKGSTTQPTTEQPTTTEQLTTTEQPADHKPLPQVPSITKGPEKVQLSMEDFSYNKISHRPVVVLKDVNGNAIPTSEYTVSYSGNGKDVGVYTVTVTMKGNGKKYISTYNVNPKGTKLSKVKSKKKSFYATWKKQRTQTTGYQLQYSTKKSMKSAKVTTVTKNKTKSKTIKRLKKKKKYYVRIRTYRTVKYGGKKIKLFSTWSKIKSVKVR